MAALELILLVSGAWVRVGLRDADMLFKVVVLLVDLGSQSGLAIQ